MNMKLHFCLLAAAGFCLSTVASLSAQDVDPLDWPFWSGPQQNHTSLEKELVDTWNPKTGENVIWKSAELGGRSTPIVLRGKLYTIVRADPGTPTEGEKVVCVDAATGKKIWENRFNVYLSDVPDTRVGWASCTGDPATGRIYALGVCGLFQCLDGETGKTIWSHSMHEEFGLLSTYGGRTNTPVIFEDLVIINSIVIGWDKMAKPAHRFVAYDKKTGEVVWFNGTRLIPYDTTYSTPTITVLDGQAALVFGSGDGAIWAMQPRTGNHIWKYQFSRRGINVSPLVVGNQIFASHSEENFKGVAMGGLVSLDGSGSGDLTGKEDWRLWETMIGKSSPLMIDGRLYTIDDRAKMYIYDSETGEKIALQKLGTVQRSTPLYADGKIYTCTNNGRWYILQPTDDGVKVLHKMRLPTGESSDGSLIVSHGRIFFPTSGHLYCIGDKNAKPSADPLPSPPQESPVAKDDKPAHVQIVPCEVLLRPGEKQQFEARLFNARGRRLPNGKAIFEISGDGKITSDGAYTATVNDHTAAFVKCKVGDLVGEARIRVVPPLPWKWDFNELDDVPITWVGGRVRHEVREVDGEKVAVKRDKIPTRPGQFTKLGTRSRTWFGQPDLKNYTITADCQGQIKDSKMPDIGLINQGYAMELQGASQKLQIRSWCTQLRMASTIKFPWKPNVWYSMKMTTSIEDGKAIVRGKVWPRDQKEPAEWTIEAVDQSPNLNGSPGLFGNAKDAEFYLDNISVTANK